MYLSKFLLFALTIILSSCCTIVNTTKQDIYITSEPSEATIKLNDVNVGITPMMVEIPRDNTATVTLTKDNYIDQVVKFNRSMSNWYIAGNLFSFSLSGWLVDYLTGSMYYLEPETIHVILKK